MVNLILRSNNISPKVSKYEEKMNKVEDSSNTFTTADGKTHKCILSNKMSISVSLENLTDSEKNNVIASLGADTVSVTYGSNTGTFFGNTAPSVICYSDNSGNHWDIDFTLEEV